MSKDRDDLSNIIDRVDLIDLIDLYKFLLGTHETYTSVDCLPSHKRNLKMFKGLIGCRKHVLTIMQLN